MQPVRQPGDGVAAGGCGEPGADLVAASLDPGVHDVFLGREVVEERLPRHVRGVGDLVDAGLLVAVLDEQSHAGVQDAIAGLLLARLSAPSCRCRCHFLSVL